jgi:hypothetical protein
MPLHSAQNSYARFILRALKPSRGINALHYVPLPTKPHVVAHGTKASYLKQWMLRPLFYMSSILLNTMAYYIAAFFHAVVSLSLFLPVVGPTSKMARFGFALATRHTPAGR